MTHDLSSRIEYSEKYVDDTHEYRYIAPFFPYLLASVVLEFVGGTRDVLFYSFLVCVLRQTRDSTERDAATIARSIADGNRMATIGCPAESWVGALRHPQVGFWLW